MRNNQNEEQKPLLVQIPETQEYIDVRPLITFLSDEGSIKQAAEAQVYAISDTIRTLNTRFIFKSVCVDEAHIQQRVFDRLYGLKDLFSSFSIITGKKGGQS